MIAVALLGWRLALADSKVAPDKAPAGMLRWEDAKARSWVWPSPARVAKGKKLYHQRCAICHGNSGKGDGQAAPFQINHPRNFIAGVFKYQSTSPDDPPSDMDLFRSITAGFPAHGMPSYRYLSEKERWALVHYVKSLSEVKWKKGVRSVKLGAEPKLSKGYLARGKAHYETLFKCNSCHGDLGRGDGPQAAALKDHRLRPIKPLDFTKGKAFRKAGWQRRDIVRLLVTGIGGTPMTSFTAKLPNKKDLTPFWEVAAYVEHLMSQAGKGK